MNKLGPASGQRFAVLPDEAERFWAFVERGDGCWTWRGRVGSGGYGAFNLQRVRRGPINAHRVAYAIANGPIPAGKVVMHACDNPPCVNPAHLRLGTQAENMADMVEKGRSLYPRRRGHRISCRSCGASRDGVPARRYDGENNTALCDACYAATSERLTRLRLHRSRSAAATRGLRVIPPSDFADLVALVGDHRARLFARYFGAYDHDAETLEVIGADVGVSRERVRQIVERVQDLLLQEYAMNQAQMKKAA